MVRAEFCRRGRREASASEARASAAGPRRSLSEQRTVRPPAVIAQLLTRASSRLRQTSATMVVIGRG